MLASGTIDALIDRRIIVDYKTGRPRDELHERYEWQLRLYAAAVRSLLGITPAEALLYYADLGEERAVDIGGPYMDEALERAAAAIASMRIPVTNYSL
jgi:CRISPR/Cas system-associated exonuclease Cas4 (RecB family)